MYSSPSVILILTTAAGLVQFEEIRIRHNSLDDHRELLLRKIRDVERISKRAIFMLHRGDVKTADDMVSKCATSIKELQVCYC